MYIIIMTFLSVCDVSVEFVFIEMSLASQSMYRAVKEVYEPEWVGYTELTSSVEVSVMHLCNFVTNTLAVIVMSSPEIVQPEW